MVMTQARIDNLNLKYAGTLSNRMAVPEQQMLTSNLQSQTGAEARLAAKIEDTQIAVARQAQLAEIAEKKAERIAQIKADVSLQKDLKQHEIFVGTDGTVRYMQELFQGKITGELDFAINPNSTERLCSKNDTKEAVFRMTVKIKDQENCYCIRVKDIGKKKAIDRLDSMGINFRFSQKKEKEARRTLLGQLLKMAKPRILPDRHGWSRVSGALTYAGSSTETWQEVIRNV